MFPARTAVLAVLAGGLVAGLFLAPVTAGAEGPRPATPTALPDPLADLEVHEWESTDSDRPRRGRAAVRALGDDLAATARLNGMSPRRLVRLLTTDHTAWVDPLGTLYYQDPGTSDAASTAAERGDGRVAPRPAAGAAYQLADALELHSKPDSAKTIHLDFDGATVSGTQWNDVNGVSTAPVDGWDPSGNGSTVFDTDERTAIARIWAQVAEDYAPFDVDVTTEDPGAAGITRSSVADPTYGTHVVVTDSPEPQDAICGDDSCGGVALLDTFDHYPGSGGNPQPHSYFQPAWIFPLSLSDDPKAIAEAISHEVGHTLSLEHDGDGSGEYSDGHPLWAPIMGAGYYEPVTQFSKGDYAGATNSEDDLALIGARIPHRTDEAGGTVATAAGELPVDSAYITTRTDTDVFALGTCTGTTTVTATPAATSPNLDIRLRVLDGSGTQLAAANPVSAKQTAETASGMGASISQSLPAGTYYAEVDGVGNGTPTTGYDDYGSVGAYTLAATGCVEPGPPPGAPSAPQDVTASPDPAVPDVTVAWSAPASTGDSALTGFEVRRSDGPWQSVGPGVTEHTFTGLEPATPYTFLVRARNAVGRGPSVSVDATTSAPATVPTAPRDFVVEPVIHEGAVSLLLTWSPPQSDGGDPVSGYEILVNGVLLSPVEASTTSVLLLGPVRGEEYDLEVLAFNDVGNGPGATTTHRVPGAPPAPGNLAVTVADADSASVSWSAPAGYPAALVTGWAVTVVVDGVTHATNTAPAVRSLTWDGLAPGQQVRFQISAQSLDLLGAAAVSGTLTLPQTPTVPQAPSAPRLAKVSPGKKGKPLTVTVRWQPPATTGTSAITRYQVVISKLNRHGRTTRTTTVSFAAGARSGSLKLGKGRYRFAVRAVSAAGTSAPSATSKAVAPR